MTESGRMEPDQSDSNAARRQELAIFLKTRRARLAPADLGLSQGLRRRTPGLRREEVADLIGVSASWITKLEQGLDIRVSSQLLQRLANALRLTAVERVQLYRLGLPEAANSEVPVPEDVLPAIQTMIDGLTASPAFILTPRSEYIGSNQAARAFFGDFETFAGPERNQLLSLFLHQPVRQYLPDWWESARQQVALFRSTFAKNANDPYIQALVNRLREESPEFLKIWNHYDLPIGGSRRITFEYQDNGAMIFEYYFFFADVNSEFRVEVFTPLIQQGTVSKMQKLLHSYSHMRSTGSLRDD
jgi:transcriptional regulator with XRE-family HTH domain